MRPDPAAAACPRRAPPCRAGPVDLVNARHVIQRALNPRFLGRMGPSDVTRKCALNQMASGYDVAVNLGSAWGRPGVNRG